MTIQEAFKQLIDSPEYKEIAKKKQEGGRYRVYKGRFLKGLLKDGAMIEVLLAHGYEVSVNKPQ